MIINVLAQTMYKKNIDKRDLVKMTGLDNHTINKLYKGETKGVTTDTLNRLCFALECDTNGIFKYVPD